VNLEVKDWKVFLQERKNGNYDLCRAGWIGDYLDPYTFLDLFHSRSGNNDVFYKNTKFDALLEDISAAPDAARRLDLTRQAEKMLIGDDMAVAPLYFYVQQFASHPKLRGVVRNPLGYIYFDRAYFEQ
jgi:oligopeptide transport system substrate-binding protein